MKNGRHATGHASASRPVEVCMTMGGSKSCIKRGGRLAWGDPPRPHQSSCYTQLLINSDNRPHSVAYLRLFFEGASAKHLPENAFYLPLNFCINRTFLVPEFRYLARETPLSDSYAYDPTLCRARTNTGYSISSIYLKIVFVAVSEMGTSGGNSSVVFQFMTLRYVSCGVSEQNGG